MRIKNEITIAIAIAMTDNGCSYFTTYGHAIRGMGIEIMVRLADEMEERVSGSNG